MEVNKKIVNSILYLWIIIMYIYTAAGWRRPGPADDFLLQQVRDQVQADAQLLQPVGGPRIVGLFGAQQTPE